MVSGGNLSLAWSAAAEVTASAYNLPAAVLMAETRGRGPRPPARVWQAKKMAVHLAVVLTGASYSAIAREIGFHRDTVTSQCADMREARNDDPQLDELALGLETSARLRMANAMLTPREVALSAPLDELLRQMRALADAVALHPTLHPTK